MHTFLAPAWLACAFLARVPRIARASLDRVLSGTRSASLCSYREGSYKAIFTVHRVFSLSQAALPMRARHLDLLAEGGRWLADDREVRTDRVH